MDVYNRIESWMKSFGFLEPWNIDLQAMADELELLVIRGPIRAAYIGCSDLDLRVVFIDTRKEPWRQRITLAHEISHHWLHSGCQLWMPKLSRELQEWEAKRLSFHLLAPDYMLACRLNMSVWELSEEFGMPMTWIRQRMDIYWSKHSLHGGI
ncbi:ImmA/IrrE family metallo-endopeptidase [Alicyclobacillus sendaiensis]|uniref:ImmA/IrrE family metallo-endopeptidase n=1 Tax=Alicyclobacillus sendaiensis TaxID=192387 RepID=UPI0026F424F9|nr:ImmA/IrrE family metallo-endopeptidase [Alicyclobacillus sendaiensis]